MPILGDLIDDMDEIIDDVKELVDKALYSNEALAIGAGLLAASAVGYAMRHPEMTMYMASEAGDIIEEAASELGAIGPSVEIGTD